MNRKEVAKKIEKFGKHPVVRDVARKAAFAALVLVVNYKVMQRCGYLTVKPNGKTEAGDPVMKDFLGNQWRIDYTDQ